jgi:hypothetical protein
MTIFDRVAGVQCSCESSWEHTRRRSRLFGSPPGALSGTDEETWNKESKMLMFPTGNSSWNRPRNLEQQTEHDHVFHGTNLYYEGKRGWEV